jgi:formimidoylglutamate deiminase
VAGLCPTTEANLGDGLFPAPDFLGRGGRIGVGSDSHVSVSPVEELRWLEYGQRLTLKRRNVLAGEAGGSTGARLLGAVLDGGATALGAPVGRITPGYRADLIALDTWSPSLAAVGDDRLVDAWLFSGNAAAVRDVWVAGRPLVEDCRHHDEGELGNRFRAVMRRIRSQL